MNASLDTLFLPLESGAVPSGGRTLFIGAVTHPFLTTSKPDLWQPFKPFTAGLPGVQMLPSLPAAPEYDLVLVNIPKQVQEAKFWIASALYALKAEGMLVLAAANDANGNRLEKWCKELRLSCQSETKNKARVVWATRPQALSDLLDDWLKDGDKQIAETGDGFRFLSQPGVFGWDKIDMGSALLAECFTSAISGIGADFGAGTGYLSYRLLQASPAVSTLYVAEADSRALECAHVNLENVRGGRTLEYLWADLAKPATFPALDFVVMNPPFHTGKKTDTGLGHAFIETAAHHLKKGGKLYMVANAHLPYEQILRQKFAHVRALSQEQGFKVFEAIK